MQRRKKAELNERLERGVWYYTILATIINIGNCMEFCNIHFLFMKNTFYGLSLLAMIIFVYYFYAADVRGDMEKHRPVLLGILNAALFATGNQKLELLLLFVVGVGLISGYSVYFTKDDCLKILCISVSLTEAYSLFAALLRERGRIRRDAFLFTIGLDIFFGLVLLLYYSVERDGKQGKSYKICNVVRKFWQGMLKRTKSIGYILAAVSIGLLITFVICGNWASQEILDQFAASYGRNTLISWTQSIFYGFLPGWYLLVGAGLGVILITAVLTKRWLVLLFVPLYFYALLYGAISTLLFVEICVLYMGLDTFLKRLNSEKRLKSAGLRRK